MDKTPLIKKIEVLQEHCIGLATSSNVTYEDYEKARSEILEEASLSHRLPEWLRSCRYGSQYWSFIKPKYKTYRERREFLWTEFRPLIEYAEQIGIGPTARKVEEILNVCTSASVQDAWHRCFERREHDPEGAITAARTLLESTCKHILDYLGETYVQDEELPKLYKLTAKALRLSPDQHHEQIFKQILGGCGSVIEGLGALRNKFGDAHGRGVFKIKPSRRHAELAVNLSGAICCFLISTFEEKQFKKNANNCIGTTVVNGASR